jgi:hypothetical protein
VDIQEVIDGVQNRVDRLEEIESLADDRIGTLENIKERAMNTKNSLEDTVYYLNSIADDITEAESIDADAEYENLV